MWVTAVLASALVRATVLLTICGGDGGGEGGEGGEGEGGGGEGGGGEGGGGEGGGSDGGGEGAGVVQPGILYAHNDGMCKFAAAMKVVAVESAQPLTAYVHVPAVLALLL